MDNYDEQPDTFSNSSPDAYAYINPHRSTTRLANGINDSFEDTTSLPSSPSLEDSVEVQRDSGADIDHHDDQSNPANTDSDDEEQDEINQQPFENNRFQEYELIYASLHRTVNATLEVMKEQEKSIKNIERSVLGKLTLLDSFENSLKEMQNSIRSINSNSMAINNTIKGKLTIMNDSITTKFNNIGEALDKSTSTVFRGFYCVAFILMGFFVVEGIFLFNRYLLKKK